MARSLQQYIARMSAADRSTRLETLLDLAARLPPLPPELQHESGREARRVPECQTAVYLWAEVRNGAVRLAAEVPRESPTVRGFVSLLVDALDALVTSGGLRIVLTRPEVTSDGAAGSFSAPTIVVRYADADNAAGGRRCRDWPACPPPSGAP